MTSLLSSADVKCLEKAGPGLRPHTIRRFDESLLNLKSCFMGRVVKSFQHAVWVEDQGSARLLTMLHESRHLVPYGFVCPEKGALPKCGARVEISGRRVKIEGPAADEKIYFLKGDGINLAGSKMSGFLDEGLLAAQMNSLFELLPQEGKAFLNRVDKMHQGGGMNGERINGARTNGEGMNGERINGERINDERINGEEMNGEEMNGEGMNGEGMNGEGNKGEGIKGENNQGIWGNSGAFVADKLESLLVQRFVELSGLLTGRCVPDKKKLRASSFKLLGLGGGLTPTGDDLLVAAAAVLNRLEAAGNSSFERVHEIRETCKRYRECLSELPFERTTIAGHEMLRWAAEGVFAEPILTLVESLGRWCGVSGGVDLLEQKVSSLLRMGGRSGRDVLCGVIVLIRDLCSVVG